MPTPATNGGQSSIGDAAKEVAERASAIARLEVELATLELKRKAQPFGIGIGFALAAAILLLFMLGFVFAAIGAALALVMPWWAALLVVAGILLLLIAVCVLVAINRFQKGSPPVPEQAITEAKLTTEALKADGG
jgi:putative superfamily III holin-X